MGPTLPKKHGFWVVQACWCPHNSLRKYVRATVRMPQDLFVCDQAFLAYRQPIVLPLCSETETAPLVLVNYRPAIVSDLVL